MRIISTGSPLAALAAAALGIAGQAHAVDGVVGPGNCNEAGFAGVLATVDGSGGGTVTFDCGNATIPFTSYKTISGNVVIDGGGHIVFDGGGTSAFLQIFFSADATLRGLTFRHGVFSASHAIENFGHATLDTVLVSDNASTEAAVVNYGTMRIVDSTFSNNTSGGSGGAISSESGATMLTVDSSTFSGNSAVNGGAIRSTAPLTVVNSTFSGNAASSGGGGIYQSDTGAAVVELSTFVGNSAAFGAGIYNDGGGSSTMTVGESLLSGNATGNCDGVIASSGYNLSDDTHCGAAFTGTGDVNNVTLSMMALGDNGGPTATAAPAAGNPAINHIPPGACTQAYDQRGAARPFGAGCDSGAFEVGATVDRIFDDGFDG